MFFRPKVIRCHFHFPNRWIRSDFSCVHLQTIFRRKRHLIRTLEYSIHGSQISKFYAINEEGIEFLGQSIDFSNQRISWDPYVPFPCIFISQRSLDSAIQIQQLKTVTKIFLWEYPYESTYHEFKHIYFPEKDSKENIMLIRVKADVASNDLYFSIFWENTPARLYEDNDEKIIDISVCKIFVESDPPPTNASIAHCSHICLDDNDNLIVFLGPNYTNFDRYVEIPLQELFRANCKPMVMDCHKLDKPKALDLLTPNPNNLYESNNLHSLFFFESGLILPGVHHNLKS